MDKLLDKTSACNGTSPAKGGPVKFFQKLLLWCSPRCTQDCSGNTSLQLFKWKWQLCQNGSMPQWAGVFKDRANMVDIK